MSKVWRAKTMKTLAVLEILRNYSDTNSYISTEEIIEKAEQEYQVKLTENNVIEEIKTLNSHKQYEVEEYEYKPNRYAYRLVTRKLSDDNITTGLNAIANAQMSEVEKKILIKALGSDKSVVGKRNITREYHQIEKMVTDRDNAEPIKVNLAQSDRIVYEYLLKHDSINYDEIAAITPATAKGSVSNIVKRMKDNNIITVSVINGRNICKLKNKVEIPEDAVSLEEISDLQKINEEKKKKIESRRKMKAFNEMNDQIDEIIGMVAERVKWHNLKERPFTEIEVSDKQYFKKELKKLLFSEEESK